jgi:phage baseplate assembly protein W
MPDLFHALRYPIAVDANAGRLARETDYDQYIDQLIRQVLLTGQGERINRPDFGAGLRQMVMAPNGMALASLAQTLVYHALSTWLGQFIVVEKVDTRAINERLDIYVQYTVRARGEQRELTLQVVP